MSINHIQLAQELEIKSIDLLLLYIAVQAIRESGHRYGSFIDAASTAAKFAVYFTYLDNGRNFRKTGILHHIEPKRVKVIVQEIEQAIQKSTTLKTLGSTEPDYLIGIPHLWREKYPWKPGSCRVNRSGLTEGERKQIDILIPDTFPGVLLLEGFELELLIEEMHMASQDHLPEQQQVACSDSLKEHIKFQLLYSETIAEISVPFIQEPLFALIRTSYSPKGYKARFQTMIDDTVRFTHLMQKWVDHTPDAFRAIETLMVHPSQREQAFNELDHLLQAWADKYHRDNDQSCLPMILQMALGVNDSSMP